MRDVPPVPAGHPDRVRWNAKYQGTAGPSFAAHRLATRALDMPLPDGPVLDLASGPSGSALLAAAAGRLVTAVDISEVALDLLEREARRRGLADRITLVQADLPSWRPPEGYSLVLCTGYWDRAVFETAAATVTAGGLLAWEAFTEDARLVRPDLPPEWCLRPGEPASLLPNGFTVIHQQDLPTAKRNLLATRTPTAR